MPRFQLLVREPGKEPRTVPLNDPIIVGRSRSVDLPVDDEEVGRKQFRIGVNQGFVVLDSLGTTNPTRVDSRVIKAGESTTLDVGQTISIGKSTFILEAAGTTVQRAPTSPDAMDVTMVARGPGPGPGAPATPPRAAPSWCLTSLRSRWKAAARICTPSSKGGSIVTTARRPSRR